MLHLKTSIRLLDLARKILARGRARRERERENGTETVKDWAARQALSNSANFKDDHEKKTTTSSKSNKVLKNGPVALLVARGLLQRALG